MYTGIMWSVPVWIAAEVARDMGLPPFSLSLSRVRSRSLSLARANERVSEPGYIFLSFSLSFPSPPVHAQIHAPFTTPTTKLIEGGTNLRVKLFQVTLSLFFSLSLLSLFSLSFSLISLFCVLCSVFAMYVPTVVCRHPMGTKLYFGGI